MKLDRDNFFQWEGYKIMQNNKYMKIYCKYKNLELIEINKAIGYMHKIPILGYTFMKIHSPELPNILSTIDSARSKCELNNISALSLITPYQSDTLTRYLTESGGTFIINLSLDEYSLLNKLNKTTRNRIRYAAREGISIECTNHVNEFNDWWKIYLATSIRKGFRSQDYNMILEVFKHSDLSRLFVTKIQDKIIGGAFLLTDKKIALYRLGAMDLAYSKYGSNNLLHWEIINWAKESGYICYDLGGAIINREHGPTVFKRGFGGEFKSLYSYDIPIKSLKYNMVKSLIRIHELLGDKYE